MSELLARFSSGTFSETDVSALLVLLRERSGGGPILELAQSIAHSKRESGNFFQRIRANQSLLNDLGKREGILDARYLFSEADFASNLNQSLRKHGFAELDRTVIDLILLCGLSLLQGSSIKGGKTFGELLLTLTSDHCELRAVMPIEYKGKTVKVSFPLAAVANKWLPVCNPRAQVDSIAPVAVAVRDFQPVIDGFKKFEVYFEREPPIGAAEVSALASLDPRIRHTLGGVEFVPIAGPSMKLRYDDRRLTVDGRPEFFARGSEYEAVLKAIHGALGGCVHDDSNAHWFLPLDVAPDGFHSHRVGRGAVNCTRPM